MPEAGALGRELGRFDHLGLDVVQRQRLPGGQRDLVFSNALSFGTVHGVLAGGEQEPGADLVDPDLRDQVALIVEEAISAGIAEDHGGVVLVIFQVGEHEVAPP